MKISTWFFVILAFLFLQFLPSAKNDALAAPCSPSPSVKIVEDSSYAPSSIQDAYDHASSTLPNFKLLLAGGIFYEDLDLNGGAAVLDGGYDCTFTTKESSSSVFGTVTIAAGSLNFAEGTGGFGVVSTDQCDFDIDLDGFTRIGSCAGSANDCNDNDLAINPGALEVCGDGIDQDCNGIDENCPSLCEIPFCPTSEDCTAAGGYWWSDNTCQGVPEAETVISAGRRWMDRNLGADQVATSPTDLSAYGFYYQWGRGTDGHQLLTSGLTWETSTSDTPGHGDFILTETPPYDWRIPRNDNLWQGESGTNNPCPAGFRIPTKAEWEAEMASWTSMDSAGAFNSPLKIALGGFHCHFCGEHWDPGDLGYYWSSTVSTYAAYNIFLDSNTARIEYNDRAYGYNVRCIQD